MKLRILFMMIFPILMASYALLAQELPPPDEQPIDLNDDNDSMGAQEFLENPDVPYTGTLAEDDPENEDLQEEKKLFGEDEVDEEQKNEGPPGTHLLRFEFTAMAQFVHHQEGVEAIGAEPYMEIEYVTRFEFPIPLLETRQTLKAEADYDINNWGSLAQNEFFDCKLDINLQQLPVEVTTRLNKLEAPEGEEPKFSLAAKIVFNKDSHEDWFALCSDASGATLNTQGEQEEYNLKILELIEPSLRGIVVDEFDRFDDVKIDLSVPAKTVEDRDLADDIVLSGNGSITIEPL